MLHQIALELQQTRTGYDTVLLSRERQLGIFDRVIIGPAASPVSFEGIPACGFRGKKYQSHPIWGLVSPPDTTFAERWRERRWNVSPALPPQFLSCSGGWQLIASRFVLSARELTH